MIYDIGVIVEWILVIMILLLGDFIFIGIFVGVGFIEDGDIVLIIIEGIGIFINFVVCKGKL